MLEGLTGSTAVALLAELDLLGISTQLWKLLLVLAGFSVVIFFHELGHFLVAKWAGIRVDRFAIGFGRELLGITRGETRYSLNVLPLGGYVKMLGQEDFAVDKSGEWKVRDDPKSFTNKPVGRRMMVVSAGVVMNVIFAAILYMVVFLIGMETQAARVGLVVPESPADLAGLQTGDEILSIDGRKVADFVDVQMSIVLAEQYEKLDFKLRRDGRIVHAQVIPETSQVEKRLSVGISQGLTNRIFSVAEAVNVPGQPSLEPLDRIVGVDGTEVGENEFHLVWRALLAAAGRPVTLTVERPVDRAKPEGPTERLEVQVRAPLSFFPQVLKDEDTRNLLGLVPRRQIIEVEEGSRSEVAGLKRGDVVVQWGSYAHPTYSEMTNTILASEDRDLRVTVLRDGQLIHTAVRPKRTGRWWRERKPMVGASLLGIEESASTRGNISGLVVASILDSIQGELTPAAALLAPSTGPGDEPIRRGALLLAAAGKPLDSWLSLIEILQSEARRAFNDGKRYADVPITYLNPDAGEPCTRELRVPVSLKIAAGLGDDAIITEIAGQRSVYLKNDAVGHRRVDVRFWMAAKQLLREHVGETVTVRYYLLGDQRERTAQFAVGNENADPWLMRISFYNALLDITPYPIMKKLVADGPIDALWIGVRKTGYVIAQAYLTFRRMVFDRTVGIENISGPVGIVKMGSDILDAGAVRLLYFLALISANLAVINFLPLPILDGGLMVFLIIEKIKGSPISLKTQVVTQLIGLALIIAAFLFVTIMDISKL